MIVNLAYAHFLGLHVVDYFGMLTFVMFLTTAILGYSILKGIGSIKLGTHRNFAILAFLVALFHVFLALSGTLNY